MSKKAWTKAQVEELLEAYRKERVLYEIKNPLYHNRNLRNQAFERVLAAVRLVRPEATLAEITSKLHSLRNGYTTELKKVMASTKSGCGTDEVYVPNLWYFKLLEFLRDNVTPRESTSMGFDLKNKGVMRIVCPAAAAARGSPSSSSLSESTSSSPMVTTDEDTMEGAGVSYELNEDATFFASEGHQEVEFHSDHDYSGPPQSVGRLNADTDSQAEDDLEAALCSGETSARSPPRRRSTTPTPSVSMPAITTPSLSGSASAINSRRRRQKEKEGEMTKLLKALAQPLQANVNVPTQAQPARDTVDYCMDFLGAMIKEIKDPALRQNVITEITSIVMERRAQAQ